MWPGEEQEEVMECGYQGRCSLVETCGLVRRCDLVERNDGTAVGAGVFW
jgi:hypothetical protein